jgi:tRNA/rRNA methyltransferase
MTDQPTPPATEEEDEVPRLLLNNVAVVLVEPLYGGNIGSAARAMKNMGIEELVLVRPREFMDDFCVWMARGATDVLERARLCDTLDEALAPYTIPVAASRRIGKFRRPDFPPRRMARMLAPLSATNRIALVFGREDDGLSREEVAKCQHVVTIPSSPRAPSLNLAQSVLVCCYELHLASLDAPRTSGRRRARTENLSRFFGHMEDVLDRMGFFVASNPGHTMTLLRRIFARAELDDRDVALLRGVFRGMDNYMNVLEKRLRDERAPRG